MRISRIMACMAVIVVAAWGMSAFSQGDKKNQASPDDASLHKKDNLNESLVKHDDGVATGDPMKEGSFRAERLREHLDDARTAYQSGDNRHAIEELTFAATCLRRQAGRLVGSSREDDLRDAIEEIENLAGRLERGEVKSADEFRKSYADVYQNLAWYHYQNAEQIVHRDRSAPDGTMAFPGGPIVSPANQAPTDSNREVAEKREKQAKSAQPSDIDVNREIGSSVDYYENYTRESGKSLNENDRTAMQSLRDWTGKAIAGTGWATGEAGEALNKWGEKMREYGKQMRERVKNETTTKSTTREKDPNAE